MSLKTVVLSEQTANLTVAEVLEQAAGGGLEIRSAEGKVVAFLLPPDNEEAWAYAEASIDIVRHRDEIMNAMDQRTGVTTKELLSNAEAAGKLWDLAKAESLVTQLFTEQRERLVFSRSEQAERPAEVPSRKAKAG